MVKGTYFRRMASAIFICLFSLVFMSWSSIPSFAYDSSICAEVKIEVRQELTLERQAFDAHMRINNGLTHITLNNVAVDVRFSDKDGKKRSGEFQCRMIVRACVMIVGTTSIENEILLGCTSLNPTHESGSSKQNVTEIRLILSRSLLRVEVKS